MALKIFQSEMLVYFFHFSVLHSCCKYMWLIILCVFAYRLITIKTGVTGWENSNIIGRIRAFGLADVKNITVEVGSPSYCYGVIMLYTNNQDGQTPCCTSINKNTNVTINGISITVENTSIRIVLKNEFTHCICILGGSIASGTITSSRT